MKVYYTAKELAGLPGMPKTIKGVIDRDYPSQPIKKKDGSDSKYKEYAVSSLSPETRHALATQNTTVGYDIQATGAFASQVQLSAEEQDRQRLAARAESAASFSRLPAKQQLGAKAKMAIIKAANHYITDHHLAKKHGQDTFAHEYNLGRIDVAPWVRAKIRQFHPGTLRDWISTEYARGVMGLVDLYGNRKPSFEALRQESSPVESLNLAAGEGSLSATVATRKALPAYTLEDYTLRWIVFGFDDLPMEEGSMALPKLTPGQQATLHMEFQEKHPTRVRVDVLRPTGFSAITAWWKNSQ